MTTSTHHDHDHHHHHGLKHYHDEDMQSLSLKTHKPLDPDKFSPGFGPRRHRRPQHPAYQGILPFKGDPERFVFQGVHMILDGDHQRPGVQRRAEPPRVHRA